MPSNRLGANRAGFMQLVAFATVHLVHLVNLSTAVYSAYSAPFPPRVGVVLYPFSPHSARAIRQRPRRICDWTKRFFLFTESQSRLHEGIRENRGKRSLGCQNQYSRGVTPGHFLSTWHLWQTGKEELKMEASTKALSVSCASLGAQITFN